MKTVTKNKLYEAMFLVDSADAGSDWDGIIAAIKKILKRAKVEIVSIKKWDDRRLAYEIKGKSRGTYLLCYFRSDGQQNQQIEKAVQLSERIIRVLILCVDWMTDEDIEKDTPATRAEKEREEREAARETAKAEAEATAEVEPEDEPTPAEVVAATDETPPTEEAVETQLAEASEESEAVATPESTEEATGDSHKSQPKVAADD
ncbi:MAG: 30S ribosomal protein S6 [Phycisphaerales bacterium]|nr:MAG: 30S ribosomal protein S6 [Phycisphaerales bacterium]